MRDRAFRLTLVAVLLLAAIPCLAASSTVNVREESLVVPTYAIGPACPSPMFYHGRTYQGAQGRIYPYPMNDQLTGEKKDREYKVIYLENEYLELAIVPELGGRIFWATDKTNGYDFFYRQHVVKPALIGMLGAWISGGVEWNIPHHHRATTMMPVEYRIEEGPGGSKTVWLGEIERRDRMKWLVGLTLHPGRSCIEKSVRIFNRTPLANSMLYFANVAVHTNKDYQIIFPPDTQFGTHHSKVEFCRWPIGDGAYGRADFNGVDMSWYKNHPTPNSVFCWNETGNFVAGYDHGKKAGTLFVADPNVFIGKKFFTWGVGPEGQTWDRTLTDDDGPYLELMIGAWSDNQPDYSWMAPGEVRMTKGYWYPLREIGGAKAATPKAAVNLEIADGKARVGFCATAEYPAAEVVVTAKGADVFRNSVAIGPGRPFVADVPLPAGAQATDVQATLRANGDELVTYRPVALVKQPKPEPVKPPLSPKEIKTNEELYLAGLRLEQFHNARKDPLPYYEEALRRDPGDSRVNVQLGLNRLKRGMFAEAEAFLRQAADRVSKDYTRPKSGEAHYYLGVALQRQGKFDEAEKAFQWAAWDHGQAAAAHYALAQIASRRGDYQAALEQAEQSLCRNSQDPRTLSLQIALLRRLGRFEESAAIVPRLQKVDPLDFHGRNEIILIARKQGDRDRQAKLEAELGELMRGEVQNYLELAVDYGNAGLWDEAADVLDRRIGAQSDAASAYPMLLYFRAYYAEQKGDEQAAARYYRLASQAPADYCFPYRAEAIAVLNRAIECDPQDARAPYYLGNLLFDHQKDAAIALWEKSRAIDPSLAMVHRNLGLAYARVQNNLPEAVAALERSVSLRDDSQTLAELDQLYEQAAAPAAKRLAMLDAHHNSISTRDKVLARQASLLVRVGQFDRALAILGSRPFYRWEGEGTGNHENYVAAHLLRGHGHFAAGRFQEALADYRAALEFPENLHAGYSTGSLARVYYFIAQAEAALGNRDAAQKDYQNAIDDADRLKDRSLRGWTQTHFYRALAQKATGDQAAKQAFEAMLAEAEKALRAAGERDVFAKFDEEEARKVRQATAHFAMGLAQLGLDRPADAREAFRKALALDPDHVEARWRESQLQSQSSPGK